MDIDATTLLKKLPVLGEERLGLIMDTLSSKGLYDVKNSEPLGSVVWSRAERTEPARPGEVMSEAGGEARRWVNIPGGNIDKHQHSRDKRGRIESEKERPKGKRKPERAQRGRKGACESIGTKRSGKTDSWETLRRRMPVSHQGCD